MPYDVDHKDVVLPEYLTGGPIPKHLQSPENEIVSLQQEHLATYNYQKTSGIPRITRWLFNHDIAGAVARVTMEIRIPPDFHHSSICREIHVTVVVFGRKFIDVSLPVTDKTIITKPRVLFTKVLPIKK